MICHFNHQPCKYINCPIWDEGRQRCMFQLAMLKILAWPATELGQQSPLTETEADILGLVAQGRHNSQIADQLGMPLKRVEKCVSGILVRLGAKNRAHAVSIAIRRGIIAPPEDNDKKDIPG